MKIVKETEDFIIYVSNHDDTEFIATSKHTEQEARAMGDEFNFESFQNDSDLTTIEDFENYLRSLIEFAKNNEINNQVIDSSNLSDFFQSELYDDPFTDDVSRPEMDQEYVILKLEAGIFNAKSCFHV